jgi:NIMA (never in mitosis gene a)-related kinase 1/4/5
VLCSRCESGLGNMLYERAYNSLKEMTGRRNKEIRKALVEILGEENIGYWALLEQIVYLETCLI